MYLIIYFLCVSLVFYFTNNSNEIDLSSKYAIEVDRQGTFYLLGLFFVSIVLSSVRIINFIFIILFTVLLIIALILINSNRKEKLLKLKEDSELVFKIINRMLDVKTFSFSELPFDITYKLGEIREIIVEVEPTKFNEKYMPEYTDQLNNFLPKFSWSYEKQLEKRKVIFIGRDKPPDFAAWVGSWLQDYRFFPLGLSGKGEVGARIDDIKAKDLNVSQTIDANGENYKLDISTPYQPHTLCCGATGGGKSVVIQNKAIHAIEHRNHISTLMLDPKIVEFQAYKNMNGVVAVASTLEEICKTLRVARQVMLKRNAELAKLGLKKIQEYKPKNYTGKIFITGVEVDENTMIKCKIDGVEQEMKAIELHNYLNS